MTTMSWSPARSTAWRTCPRQFLYRDVLQAAPAQFEAPRRQRGRVMHAGMEGAFRALYGGKHRGALTMAWYIGEAHDAMREHADAALLAPAELADCLQIVANLLAALEVPNAGSILGIEYPFSFVHKGIPINGIMDLALRTGPKSLRVVDWKSGRITSRTEQLEGNVALATYSIAAGRIWPWAEEIEVGLHSMRYNESTFLVVTRELQELALARVVGDFHAAESARHNLDPLTLEDVFPTKPGEHCSGCLFRSYCPLFAESNPPVRPGVDVEAERARLEARISLAG
jgi:putative RecB family exonuclease